MGNSWVNKRSHIFNFLVNFGVPSGTPESIKNVMSGRSSCPLGDGSRDNYSVQFLGLERGRGDNCFGHRILDKPMVYYPTSMPEVSQKFNGSTQWKR